jgi:mono/diheme cytochrome c family protein
MKHARWTHLLSALLLLGIAAASGTAYSAPKKGKGPKAELAPAPAQAEPAAPAPSAEAMKEAKQLYATVCTTCHGATGGGDGLASAALNPKPRNFSAADWQKSTKDELIEKVILEGGLAVGKSAVMPGNPQLKSKPDVVAALRVLIRGFAK